MSVDRTFHETNDSFGVEIAMEVVPQERPRFVNGIVIDGAKSRKFKEEFGRRVKALQPPQFYNWLKMTIEVGRNRKIGQRYGDVDNIAKGIMDALTGIMYKNDAQIIDLHVVKRQTENVYIKVEVERWNDGI